MFVACGLMLINDRMLSWSSKFDNAYKPTSSPGELKIQGLELICRASSLQSDTLNQLLDAYKSARPNLFLLYYYWILAELSQLLVLDSWKILHCELPIVPKNLLQAQAAEALLRIEEEARQPGLDVALLLPLAAFIGTQLTEEMEMGRVLAFIETVKYRGFPVAQEYINELSLTIR